MGRSDIVNTGINETPTEVSFPANYNGELCTFTVTSNYETLRESSTGKFTSKCEMIAELKNELLKATAPKEMKDKTPGEVERKVYFLKDHKVTYQPPLPIGAAAVQCIIVEPIIEGS